MKVILPLLAAAGLLAACGDCHDGYCDHGRKHEHRYHHGTSEDALSDRPMGSTRGVHHEKRQGAYNSKHHWDKPVHPVAPAYVPASGPRPDGTYALPPQYEVRGYQHKATDDALSDRPLGSSRGANNEPMSAKDSDHDGKYDYVPYYAPRSNTWIYNHD